MIQTGMGQAYSRYDYEVPPPEERTATPMWLDLQLPYDASVLEVGCGEGRFAAWLALQAPQGRVAGVDNRREAIETARELFDPQRLPQLSFEVSDACRLDIPSEEPFELVVSRACLHWVSSPARALLAMARHLKGGGELRLRCLEQTTLAALHRNISGQLRSRPWRSYCSTLECPWTMISETSCQRWLEEAGFERASLATVEEKRQFPDKQEFLKWLKDRWPAYWSQMPPSGLEVFLDEFAERYSTGVPGQYRTTRLWLEIRAGKPAL